jgi:hypothetical protein
MASRRRLRLRSRSPLCPPAGNRRVTAIDATHCNLADRSWAVGGSRNILDSPPAPNRCRVPALHGAPTGRHPAPARVSYMKG